MFREPWNGTVVEAIEVAELLVRTALPDFGESVRLQQCHDFARLQHRGRCPLSSNLDGPHVDELGLEVRLAILEEHLDDLPKVLLKLFDVALQPNGPALSCRQGPPPWRAGAPMFDARLSRGRSGCGP